MRSVVPSACFVSTKTVQLALVISQPSLLSELAVTDGGGHPQLGSTPLMIVPTLLRVDLGRSAP